jgi:hypothetical protein
MEEVKQYIVELKQKLKQIEEFEEMLNLLKTKNELIHLINFYENYVKEEK